MVDPEKNKNYNPIKPNRGMKAILKKFGIGDKELKAINQYMQTSVLAIDAMGESLALYSGIKFDRDQGKVIYLEENDRKNYYEALNKLLNQNEEILNQLKELNKKLDILVNNQ